MAFPLIPVAIGAAALLLLAKGKGGEPTYSQASPDGDVTPEPTPTSKPTSELPESLKEQMITALGLLGVHPFTGELSGAADAAAIRYGTQVVGQLEAQGFREAAADLRKYVEKAAMAVPTPPTAAPIEKALPPGMTEQQRAHVARILALDRDPKVLATLVKWLEALPESPERDASIDMVRALRLQVLSAQSTNETLQKVDQIVRAPTVEAVEKVVTQALPKLPIVTTPPALPPVTVTSPGLPQPVAKPAPAPAPPPVPAPTLSPLTLAAKTMVDHVRDAFVRGGGAWSAATKRALDPNVTRAFQKLAGGTVDGMPGPATFLRAAGAGVTSLPPVPYWPKNATAATVASYRQKLGQLADIRQKEGRTAEAADLVTTASRERGQGMGLGSATATASTPVVSPVSRPPTTTLTPATSLLTQPPATIRRGVGLKPAAPSGDVILAQSKLKLADGGRYAALLGTPAVDGRFGGGTEKAVVAFQNAHPFTKIDGVGVVGPATWTALLGPSIVV